MRRKQAARPSPIRDTSNTRRELFPEDACNDAVFSLESLQRSVTAVTTLVAEFDRSARQEIGALRNRMNDLLTTITLHEAANEKQQQALQGRVLFLEGKLSEAQGRIEELEAKLGEGPQHAPHAPLWARLATHFSLAGTPAAPARRSCPALRGCFDARIFPPRLATRHTARSYPARPLCQAARPQYHGGAGVRTVPSLPVGRHCAPNTAPAPPHAGSSMATMASPCTLDDIQQEEVEEVVAMLPDEE